MSEHFDLVVIGAGTAQIWAPVAVCTWIRS